MRALILEPHANGHHATYLRWLVQAACSRKWDVAIATTRKALGHPALDALSDEFPNIAIHSINDSVGINGPAARSPVFVRRELAYWISFRQAVAEVQERLPIDFIILPYVDYCFYSF